jgi:cytoskeletal protein CcmA (bactofilin family)
MSESASFIKNVKKYVGIDYVSGDMALKGSIDILGNGSYISELTVGNIVVLGNAIIPGISSNSNGSYMTVIQATDLPSNANINIRGNVLSAGNVDATNVSTTNLRVNGNAVVTGQVNISGNVAGRYFIGNVLSAGNVDATNVSTTNLLVNGNAVVMGQVNVTGNVIGRYFLGNGALLSGVQSSLPGNTNINIRGNVFAPGNVDATNVSTTNLLVNGNAVITGQVNATGNVVGRYLLGNGALLSGVTSSAFVVPVFCAKQYLTIGLSIGTSTRTLTLTKIDDNYNCYNAATGIFNPNIAGYYNVMASIPDGGVLGGAISKLSINKNGTELIQVGTAYSTNGNVSVYGSSIAYMNGSSDTLALSLYLDPFVAINGTFVFSAYYVSM